MSYDAKCSLMTSIELLFSFANNVLFLKSHIFQNVKVLIGLWRNFKIKKVFNAVRSALIAVAAVMLLLALIGLCLSILGHQHAILIFVISGWLLVAVTFILCGVFLIFNR
ncbi:hypothetical protein QN277_029242 [Acacia crassicarpa]|uniref:Uncharacterized protein n=1 Tax=Acacia crassicarpa TaxID=499986 RepID=A0AAE1K4K9_9FABA|nr:hypothetical protein QN277_029242 [Acacia crassicarpa]